MNPAMSVFLFGSAHLHQTGLAAEPCGFEALTCLGLQLFRVEALCELGVVGLQLGLDALTLFDCVLVVRDRAAVGVVMHVHTHLGFHTMAALGVLAQHFVGLSHYCAPLAILAPGPAGPPGCGPPPTFGAPGAGPPDCGLTPGAAFWDCAASWASICTTACIASATSALSLPLFTPSKSSVRLSIVGLTLNSRAMTWLPRSVRPCIHFWNRSSSATGHSDSTSTSTSQLMPFAALPSTLALMR